MRELLLIKDTLDNKISYFHLMLFLLSLPFDRFYNHLILISFTVHTIIHFNKNNIKPLFTWRMLALQSVFFVTLISTIYTSNYSQAFREWELDISVLLFPLLFCFNQLDLKKYRPQLLTAFALGCTVTILYLYINAFATIIYYGISFSEIWSPAFTNHNFAQPIDIHATFFSLQIALSLIYLLSRLTRERLNLKAQIFYTLCCVVLSAGIIQLSSKSILITLFLVVNIAFPYFLLRAEKRKRYIMISVFISSLAVIGIFNSNAFKDRYWGQLKQDLSPGFAGQSVQPRLERWEIAGELISQSPLIGYGAGTEVILLGDQFFARKFYSSYLHHLNSHNQYLSFMLKSGIWGLAVYLATLAYGFKNATLKQDGLFFSFMLMITIVSLSENVLDMDKGVMFYSFFFSFFAFAAERKRMSISR